VKSLRRVKIAGLSTYVPPKVLTNADLETLVDTTNEWILQRTGIKERHIVGPGVATSDLAKEAACGAIRQAGITAADLGFIAVGTTTPDTIFPSTACLLQHKLAASHAWGFDVGAACSGAASSPAATPARSASCSARSRSSAASRVVAPKSRLARSSPSMASLA